MRGDIEGTAMRDWRRDDYLAQYGLHCITHWVGGA